MINENVTGDEHTIEITTIFFERHENHVSQIINYIDDLVGFLAPPTPRVARKQGTRTAANGEDPFGILS